MISENNKETSIVPYEKIELNEENVYVLKYSEKNYEIKIQYMTINNESFIRIIAQEEKKLVNYNYQIDMNKEDFLKQDNILLRPYREIHEIYNFILDSFNEKVISIKDIKDKVSFILMIKVKILGYREPLTFEIKLKKNNFFRDDIVEVICKKTNELEKENNNLKLKLNTLEEENNNLKIKVNSLEEKENKSQLKFKELEEENNNLKHKMNIIEENENKSQLKFKELKEENNNLKHKMNTLEEKEKLKFEELKNEIQKLKLDLKKLSKEYKLKNISSDIIQSKQDLNFIKNRLLKIPGRENSNINLELKYKMTKDGDSIKTFHSKCDNIPNNLVLIKTSNGVRFGGYTDKLWTSPNNERGIKDNNCFCFSLSKDKIYNVIKDKNALYCDSSYGPSFYNFFGIVNSNNLLSSGYCRECTQNNNGSFSGVSTPYEINDGNSRFKAVEIEFYKVIFE